MIKTRTYIVIALLFFCYYPLNASEQALNKADVLLKNKKYLEARDAYRAVFLKNKKGPLAEQALLGVAKADYSLKRYYESRENLNRLISMTKNPEIINETNYYLGLVALSLYNYRLAERYLSNVTGKLRVGATIAMAEAALRLNNVATAETLLKTLKALEVEMYPRGVAVRAMVDSLKGRHDRAVSSINRLEDKILNELDMTVEKAQILYYADKLKDAEAQLKKILSLPETTNVNRLRALRVLWQVYTKEDRPDDAIRVGNEMLAYEYSDDFKIKLAKLYDKKGDMANSLRVLSYIESRRLKEQEFEKRFKNMLSKKDPASTNYINRYGNYVSDNSPLLVDMARHLASEKDKKRAIEILRRASRGASAGAASLYMAELLMEENRFSEAKKALDYLSLDPRYARPASVMLGKILEREGNPASALEYYKKIYEVSRDAKVAERIGDILWQQANRAEAAKYYVLASAGGNLSGSVKAGDYYYLNGDNQRASEYYKKAIGISKEQPEYIWINYQYGKLTRKKEYLKNAASGKGEIAEAAKMLLREF